jgi:hypothetical protein
VLLLCGKPGPLSAHTPEICYAGADYGPDPNQQRWKATPDTEFTWQSFRSKVEGRPNLEIAWAWCTDGRWNCPPTPRIAFGREPFLYKLYVVRQIRRADEPTAELKDLVAKLVPALQQTVFADHPTTASSETRKGPVDSSTVPQPLSSSSKTVPPAQPAPRNATGDRSHD